jgi:hypothetical protein
VFFLLFGSSAAGKTVALESLRGRVADLAIHDFDEIEVPVDADTGWRHRATEEWARRALAYQAKGTDLLMAGQTPIGELLAAPSAPQLEAISACLLDCDEATQRTRLERRGPGWLTRVPGRLEDYLKWAEWMRGHARDPAWRPEVIRHVDTESEMHWARWSSWQAGDPRWRVRVIDTAAVPVEVVVDELAAWIKGERKLVRAGSHPLLHWVDGGLGLGVA